MNCCSFTSPLERACGGSLHVGLNGFAQEDRNKIDDKIMEAVLSNDLTKLKTLLATKKFTSLIKPDDDGRVAFVLVLIFLYSISSERNALIRLFEACKYGYKVCFT